MSLDSSRIKTRSSKFSTGDSMKMAAQSISGDASEDDVREAISEIVAKMIEKRWTLVRWIIGEKWAAKLVARIVDVVGEIILKWLR